MVRLRFASVSVSDTVAKESRIKVFLDGLMLSVAGDLSWTSDLGLFVKAPEGVSTAQ